MNSGTSLRANNKRQKAEFAGCRTAAGLRIGFLIGGSDYSRDLHNFFFGCCLFARLADSRLFCLDLD